MRRAHSCLPRARIHVCAPRTLAVEGRFSRPLGHVTRYGGGASCLGRHRQRARADVGNSSVPSACEDSRLCSAHPCRRGSDLRDPWSRYFGMAAGCRARDRDAIGGRPTRMQGAPSCLPRAGIHACAPRSHGHEGRIHGPLAKLVTLFGFGLLASGRASALPNSGLLKGARHVAWSAAKGLSSTPILRAGRSSMAARQHLITSAEPGPNCVSAQPCRPRERWDVRQAAVAACIPAAYCPHSAASWADGVHPWPAKSMRPMGRSRRERSSGS